MTVPATPTVMAAPTAGEACDGQWAQRTRDVELDGDGRSFEVDVADGGCDAADVGDDLLDDHDGELLVGPVHVVGVEAADRAVDARRRPVRVRRATASPTKRAAPRGRPGAGTRHGRARLHDPTVSHDGHLVGHRHGLGLVVGDQDRGGAGGAQRGGHLGAQLDAEAGVEGAERLVEQRPRRAAAPGPGPGPPAAAGRRRARGVVAVSSRRGRPARAARPPGPRRSGSGLGRAGRRPRCRPRRGGGRAPFLGHEPDRDAARAARTWPGRRGSGPASVDGAGVGPLHPGDGPQEGGLAAARRTEHGGEGAVGDGEVDAVERRHGRAAGERPWRPRTSRCGHRGRLRRRRRGEVSRRPGARWGGRRRARWPPRRERPRPATDGRVGSTAAWPGCRNRWVGGTAWPAAPS